MVRWSVGRLNISELSPLSTEYVEIPVSVVKSGAVVSPTADTVQFAFMPLGKAPGVSDWHAGDWETLPGPPAVYMARVLVGPGTGGVVVPAGSYVVWVKVTDNPEVPVLQAGTLVIAAT